MNDKLNLELPPELEPYRNAIEATAKPYLKIELTDNPHLTWWQSKFGGLPYMPQNFDYPKSRDGEYLYLLAQINFTEVPHLEGLPEEGILQFYIASDGMYGCDLGNPRQQDKFRVIYFEDVELNVTELVTDFSFLPQPEKYNLPLQGSSGLEFAIAFAPISGSDYQFELFEDEEGDELFDLYWQKFEVPEHRLLGYPNFTQDDPRFFIKKGEPYILLLQINSDRQENIDLMWGDLGIANFFIRYSDLIQLDFSRIIYNWDCT